MQWYIKEKGAKPLAYVIATGLILTAGASYGRKKAGHPYMYKSMWAFVLFLVEAFFAIGGYVFLSIAYLPPIGTVSAMCIVAAVVVSLDAMMVDAEYMEIPDSNNVVLALLGIAFSISYQRALLETIVPVLLVFGFFLGVSLLKESMGGGDVKMAGAMAFFLPMHMIVYFLLIAFGLGTIVGVLRVFLGKETGVTHIAFGPYITLAYIAVIAKTYLL